MPRLVAHFPFSLLLPPTWPWTPSSLRFIVKTPKFPAPSVILDCCDKVSTVEMSVWVGQKCPCASRLPLWSSGEQEEEACGPCEYPSPYKIVEPQYCLVSLLPTEVGASKSFSSAFHLWNLTCETSIYLPPSSFFSDLFFLKDQIKSIFMYIHQHQWLFLSKIN